MKARIRIDGMTCAACTSSVERALNGTEGVSRASVNLATNTASVEYDPETVDIDTIYGAIEDTGFDVVRDTDDSIREERGERNALRRLVVAAAFTIPLLYVAMGPMIGLPVPFGIHDDPKLFSVVQLILCIPVIIAGSGFYVRGFPNLVRLRPNMDTLVALGTSAALIFSVYSMILIFDGRGDAHSLYFESAATIITLVMVGKYLESRSKYKTGESVRRLTRMAPQEAHVLRDGKEATVPVGEVVVGDVVVVYPGERVPVDGTITSGTAAVDESMLTGESDFADRSEGDVIYAGTINMNGNIRMRTEMTGDSTMLSQIVHLIEDAQGSKAPVARLADKVAGVFVPTVMVIAVAACLIWLASGKDAEFALTILISVLVIACPCALGLATPLAIIVGTGKGAEHGILFRSAESLELTGRVDTVVLDKTGTITVGRPDVTDVVPLIDRARFLYIASSAETGSEHPLGRAIVSYSERNGVVPSRPSDFTAHIGNGVECTVDGRKVHGGNAAFMRKTGIDISSVGNDMERLAGEGKTVMLFSEDGAVIGIVAVADTVRATSADAVRSLQDMGIRTVMVTGDGRATAESIAAQVGLEEVIAEMLPGGKSDVIRKMQDEGRTVAMVGDGINDAPALALSDVGMAVGSGTDIAIGSSDVVLMNSDLRSVPAAAEIGRGTMRNVKQNLFFAFCYNVVGIPIAAGLLYVLGGPLLNPMIAAAAMSLSSISVVLNALRLRSLTPGSLREHALNPDSPVKGA